jgi:DNA-binding GntR family transcriptional regulator
VTDSEFNRGHSRLRLAEAIGDKIIRQQFPAGRSIGEAALATELGVSRTPVREALLGLESDGLVRAHRGRGFIVQPLSATEARQIYPIIAALERLAVETSEPPAQNQLDRLDEVNHQLASAATPHDRMRLDAAWHRALTAGCANVRLISLIEGTKQTALRYEYAYLKNAALRDTSIAEHEKIVALYRQNRKQAAKAVALHWLRGLDAVLEMLEGSE